MKEKLEIIRTNERMNASELAKKLGVEASALSHIKSGRNKPRFDFIVKVLTVFPHINPDWLLLGRGPYLRSDIEMFNDLEREDDEVQVSPELPSSDEVSLFDQTENNEFPDTNFPPKNERRDIFPFTSADGKRVERVIVLYDDKSFESYSPSQQ